MLKTLMNKELKLSVHETNYIFLSLATMLLIPNYPFYVAFFFPCLGIFYLFMNGREQNDVYFTALLPVRKRDVVKARFVTVIAIQIIQILLSIPVALIRNNFMKIPNAAGMEANIAFYGFVFVMYALFNLVFLPAFYKTGYKIGVPFIMASAAQLVLIALMETLMAVVKPISSFLDTLEPGMMIKQLPVLLAGILVYIAATVGSYKGSAALFEKLDL